MSDPRQSGRLKLVLLGPPQMERDGKPVIIPTRKATALVAYLAVTGRAHSREALATLLWPEYERARAFANLRRTLWVLNKAIGKEWLDVDAETAALRRRPGFWLDADAFRHLLTESQGHDHGRAEPCAACVPRLIEAVELYDDDFMAGFTLPDSPGFDEWQFFEREGLRSDLASALQRLVRCYTAQQEWESAITYARRWLALDPLQEPAHRELMRLYAWHGQRATALRQYQECFRILDEELGIPPEEATTRLYEAIQARQLKPLPDGVAPGVSTPTELSPQPAPRHNLPPPPTTFVGRQEELAEIARLLDNPDCRLLTLVGPGGVGKSRLALEAAAAQLRLLPFPYPHGVYLVPLAALSSAEFTVPAIADAVGFSFYESETGDATQQLLDFLRGKQMLLLLDSLEHLMEGVGLLAEIVEQAPGVKLLATSRERLNLQREWVFPVSGLRYPEAELMEPLEEYSAVRLFLVRARQADAAFSLPEAEIPDLMRICRLVEGMPLGLELAAAWVKMLSCREIAAQIEQSLDFLTTSMRDVPDRHRSMRAVCDHSWGLLTAEEQGAFQTLSVFRGGYRQEAAAQVAGASLTLLSSLVDKSLVHRDSVGRYQMHAMLQQCAADQLNRVPQAEERARDAHCAHFAVFLREREKALKGPSQLQALEGIGAELENVRAAWRWAVARGKVSEIRQAATSLWLFYEMRGLFEEAEEAFRRAGEALEAQASEGAGEEASLALGLALAYQGQSATRLYRWEQGAALLGRSLAILRPLGPQRELALANSLSYYAGAVESMAEAEQRLQESLAIFRSLGDRWGVAFALSRFAWSAYNHWGARDDAAARLRESLAIRREIGDRWGLAYSLLQLAGVLQAAGALQEAQEQTQESLAVLREIGDRQLEQMCLDHVGFLARKLQQYAEARQYHAESLAISREIGDSLGMAGSLDNLGLVAHDLGDYKEAQRYFREGLALRREAGHRWSIALSLGHLGDTALALGNHEEAQRRYQESLEVGSDPGWVWHPVPSRTGLGTVAAALGDLQGARQHFRAALEEATIGQGCNVSDGLDLVAAASELAVGLGKRDPSAQWLTYVAGHPASSTQARVKAKRLLEELAPQLPPEAMAAAREGYKNKTLDDVIAQMLEEL